MRSSRPILDALWHRIGLVPDDIASQIPTVLLESKGQAPRNAQKILRFQAFRRIRSDIHCPCGILLVRRPPPAVSTGITIPDVQPENTVFFQYSFDFIENSNQPIDELGQCRFQSYLSFNVVISQSPVRRRCDGTLNRFAWQAAKNMQSIPF